jgi:Uma2 family endonuclease
MKENAVPAALEPIDTVADLIRRLGDIPPERILWNPIPGTATEADALRLVEGHHLVELIDGILVEKAMGFPESFLAIWIGTCLNNFVVPRKLGIVGGPDLMVRLVGAQVRLPDVSYYPWTSIPHAGELREPVGRIAPALAVEVLSPSNTPREIQRKRVEFFNSGTQLFWVVDPKNETIQVFTDEATFNVLTTDDTLDGGNVLSGFALPVSELFGYLDFPSNPPSE